MTVIRISKDEAKLLLVLMDGNIADYRLRQLASRGGRDTNSIVDIVKGLRQKIGNQVHGHGPKVKEYDEKER